MSESVFKSGENVRFKVGRGFGAGTVIHTQQNGKVRILTARGVEVERKPENVEKISE